jgi:hypothetical protein
MVLRTGAAFIETLGGFFLDGIMVNDPLSSASVDNKPLRVDLQVTWIDASAADKLIREAPLSRPQHAIARRLVLIVNAALWLPVGGLIGAAMALGGIPGAVIALSMVAVLTGGGWVEQWVVKATIHQVKKRSNLAAQALVFTADPSGFTIEGPHSFSSTRWPGVFEVVDAEDYVLIFVSAMEAVYLPKRDIERQLPASDFVNRLQKLRGAAA